MASRVVVSCPIEGCAWRVSEPITRYTPKHAARRIGCARYWEHQATSHPTLTPVITTEESE